MSKIRYENGSTPIGIIAFNIVHDLRKNIELRKREIDEIASKHSKISETISHDLNEPQPYDEKEGGYGE